MKETIRNRALSLVITLVMLLGMIPFSAVAEGETYTSTVQQPENIQLIRGSDLVIEPNENLYLFSAGDSSETTMKLEMKSKGNHAYSGIAWSSSNESVAVVDPVDGTNGKEVLVTAKASGVAIITVTVDVGFKQEVQVVVLDPNTTYTIYYHVNYSSIPAPDKAYTFVFQKSAGKFMPVVPDDKTFKVVYDHHIPGDKVTLNDASFVPTVNYEVSGWKLDPADDDSKALAPGSEYPLESNLHLYASFTKTLEIVREQQVNNIYLDKDGVKHPKSSGGLLYTIPGEDGQLYLMFNVTANQPLDFYFSESFKTFETGAYEIKLDGFNLKKADRDTIVSPQRGENEYYMPGERIIMKVPEKKSYGYIFTPNFTGSNNRNTVVVIRKKRATSGILEGKYSDAFYYYVGQGVLTEHAVEILQGIEQNHLDSNHTWGDKDHAVRSKVDGSYDEIHYYSRGGEVGDPSAYLNPFEKEDNIWESIPDLKDILAALGETIDSKATYTVNFYKIGRTGKGYTLDGILVKTGVTHTLTVIDTVTQNVVGVKDKIKDQEDVNVLNIAKEKASTYQITGRTLKGVYLDPQGTVPVQKGTIAFDSDLTVYLVYNEYSENFYTVQYLDENGNDVYYETIDETNPANTKKGVYYQTVPAGGDGKVAPDPKKEGYTFQGWYTELDGKGDRLTEEMLKNIQHDWILYAFFTEGDEAASLRIKKSLPGYDAEKDGIKVFTVRATNLDTNVVYTFNVMPNGEGEQKKVPAGTYKIDEKLILRNSVAYKASYFDKDGNELTDQLIYLHDGADVTVVVENTPQWTEATVRKVWADGDDHDGKRPEELQVTLLADKEVVTKNLYGEDIANPVTLAKGGENEWTATVVDLPKYRADGTEIEYTWAENNLPEGYELTDTSVNGTVTTLTNTHEPEQLELTVSKIWDDADNKAGIRPDRLTVYLYGNEKVYGSVVLSAANEWKDSLQVPKYADGAEIKYQWIEPAVSGYTLRSVQENGTETILTNYTKPEEEPEETIYQLIVHYRDNRGNVMAEDVTGSYKAGEGYRVVSPVIEGYLTSTPVVEGTMPARNLEITVIYIREPEPEPQPQPEPEPENNPEDDQPEEPQNPAGNIVRIVEIDEYRTALGVGNVSVNIGDAFE